MKKGILGIIAGARYAQLNGQGLNTKPLIIAVYKDYAGIENELFRFINNKNWASYSFPAKEYASKTMEPFKSYFIYNQSNSPFIDWSFT
jgi:hypothetical protein